MATVRAHFDGSVFVPDGPVDVKPDQSVILHIEPAEADTAQDDQNALEPLTRAGVVGMWADRTDIGDSTDYSNKLREDAVRRDQ